MRQLPAQSPPPEILPMLGAISRLGPDGTLGPEQAGAVLILQATFASEEGAHSFWNALLPLFKLLESAPGFIRRFGLTDGPANTLIALWRSADDAHAFAATPEHRAAARALYAERWEYSHFAAVWELPSPRDRVIFCPECDSVAPVGLGSCPGCGTEFEDAFAQ